MTVLAEFKVYLSLFLFIILTTYPAKSFAQDNSQVVSYSQDNISTSSAKTESLLIDSELSLEDALSGQNIPQSLKENLELLTVQYYGFDGLLHQGQIIVHKKAANDIKEIFEFIKKSRFPIERVVPICEYKWSDEKSMSDNNTCGFNYRFVSGTKVLSMHANGLAIDINPMQNPYVKNGSSSPVGSTYDTLATGTITADSELVDEFKKRGWSWGGDWKSLKDYQHFQKELK